VAALRGLEHRADCVGRWEKATCVYDVRQAEQFSGLALTAQS